MIETTATVVQRGLAFGEAPRWHDGRLWYSDFYRRAICSLGRDGERVEHEASFQPSGLGWLPDGTLLATSMLDHRLVAIDAGGAERTHAEFSEHCGYWANDLVVAADGTAYVGNFGFDLDGWLAAGMPTPPATTSLVVVAPDGRVLQAVPDLLFPNGTVLFDDGATLVVAETLAQRLTALDVAADGTLSARRTFAQLERGYPDGICLDRHGEIWIASAIAKECLRVAEGGEVTGRVATSETAFACMLGGDDGTTLYVMTAPSSTASVISGLRDGCIEAAQVDVPHAGLP